MKRPEPDDGTPIRPLPRRLAAMSSRNRVILALIGILIGVAIMFAGLKLMSDDANTSNSLSPPAGVA